jgi:hypothetical protein
MFENLSEEIRKCRRRAEECKRKSEIALTASAIQTYLDMESGWLALARSLNWKCCGAYSLRRQLP